MAKSQISITVNGKKVEELVEPRTLLIHFYASNSISPGRI